MSHRVEYLQISATATDAALYLASRGVDAIPLCHPDGHLAGMLTEHELVVEVIAQGKDPAAFALADLAELPEFPAVGLDDAVEDVAVTMERHHAERLAVVDRGRLVGLVNRRDVARSLTFGQPWADL
jgi:CBS domain-containing protein